jgi:prepilin peptidase CpaA
MIAEYATYVMAAILVAAFAIEIRTGRIPNGLTILSLLLFIAFVALADDRGAMLWQIALAAGVFVFGLVMFAIGGMGAGAVKLLSVTSLFVPLQNAFYAFLVFLVAFFISAFLIIQIRKMFGTEDSKWHVMAKAVIPLSLPIGIAGIAGMFVL